MVSFRTGASRAASVPASRSDTSAPASPIAWTERAAARPGFGGSTDDAAIRREFEVLAGRIRTLQQRAAREAAALTGR